MGVWCRGVSVVGLYCNLYYFAPKLEIWSSGFLWEGRSLFPLCQGDDVLFFGEKRRVDVAS